VTYHVLPVILPSGLKDVTNGRLPASKLETLHSYPKGKLYPAARLAFDALALEAYFAGHELKPTSPADCYRSYDRQESGFLQRYSQKNTGRTPRVTRIYQGRPWYLKPGVAPMATPGTSNHGLGLAVDVANASGDLLEWLLGPNGFESPAIRYGFSWEVANGPNAEPWHIRYVCGDNPPPAVLEAVAAFPNLEIK
jgi:LAS superfamily LD-carboxypeptidase LdcB